MLAAGLPDVLVGDRGRGAPRLCPVCTADDALSRGAGTSMVEGLEEVGGA